MADIAHRLTDEKTGRNGKAAVAKIEERMDNYKRHLDVAEIDTIWNSIIL